MLDLAKRNESGRRAERRTEVFLLNHSWVLKLSVDLDGAIFVAQQGTRTVASVRQQAGFSPSAAVKAMFCPEGAEVEVSTLLVERPNRKAYKEFFVSVRFLNRFAAASDYFFYAEEVQSCFKRKSTQGRTPSREPRASRIVAG